jgi:hypothetical protein
MMIENLFSGVRRMAAVVSVGSQNNHDGLQSIVALMWAVDVVDNG